MAFLARPLQPFHFKVGEDFGKKNKTHTKSRFQPPLNLHLHIFSEVCWCKFSGNANLGGRLERDLVCVFLLLKLLITLSVKILTNLKVKRTWLGEFSRGMSSFPAYIHKKIRKIATKISIFVLEIYITKNSKKSLKRSPAFLEMER